MKRAPARERERALADIMRQDRLVMDQQERDRAWDEERKQAKRKPKAKAQEASSEPTP